MNDRTDPLAGWDLERGMCRGSSVPHRVQGDDQFSAGWLTDEAADQFERAQAITAAWAAQQGTARRFTAEVRECGPVFLAEIRDADGRLLGSTQVRTTRDGLGAFVAQLNASPAPAEDLPPGVVRYDESTLIARGDVVRGLPDGEWERYLHGAWLQPHAMIDPDWFYEVRRIQQPATERVPWWEALRDQLPLQAWGGPIHGALLLGVGGWQLNNDGSDVTVCPDAVGMVTVLRDGGA